MKKETIKEAGKYLLDISKIFIALAIVAPFVKEENVAAGAVIMIVSLALLGLYFTNKGAKDE